MLRLVGALLLASCMLLSHAQTCDDEDFLVMNDNQEYLRVNNTGVFGCGKNLCNAEPAQTLSVSGTTLSLTPGNSVEIPNFGIKSWIKLVMNGAEGAYATFSGVLMQQGTAFEYVPGAIRILESGVYVLGYEIMSSTTNNKNHGWINCNEVRVASYYAEGALYYSAGSAIVSLNATTYCRMQFYYGSFDYAGIYNPASMWAYKIL